MLSVTKPNRLKGAKSNLYILSYKECGRLYIKLHNPAVN